jgi:ribosome modulation factor
MYKKVRFEMYSETKMKRLQDVAWSVGYKAGFSKNKNDKMPLKYIPVSIYWERGYEAGRRDYKLERL